MGKKYVMVFKIAKLIKEKLKLIINERMEKLTVTVSSSKLHS